jgi:predicted RNase H-like nuclease (RuvC/YqgF family)
MNYIKQLQEENQELKNQITEAQETITELYKYLSLPKFYNSDNMVNVSDIFQRLESARQLLHTTI